MCFNARLFSWFLLVSVFLVPGCGSYEDPAARVPGEKGGENAPKPEPDDEGGPPIFEVMAARRSVRSFTDTPLTEDELARILWAGQGVTDSEKGFRAVPSAGALYPLTLYVCDPSGVSKYVPGTSSLTVISTKDVRPGLSAAAFYQGFIADAPVVIVVVADPSITARKYGARAERYCILEAGHAAQNMLLAAVALGLSGIGVGGFDDASVSSELGLGKGHIPLYLIAIGHVKESEK